MYKAQWGKTQARDKKNKNKTKKAAAGRVSSYLSISLCLWLPPPHISISFLSASPCYEAVMWIFMKSDLYQQNTSTLHTLSPVLLLLYLAAANFGVYFFSFSARFIKHRSLKHPNLSSSLSSVDFWRLSSKHGFISYFSLEDVCMHVSTMLALVKRLWARTWNTSSANRMFER